jgi:hypothetical protein
MMRLDFADIGKRIIFRHRQHQRLATDQRAVDIRIVGRRRVDQSHIEHALTQPFQLYSRTLTDQPKMEVGPVATKLPQHAGDNPGVDGALDIADGEAPDGAAGEIAAEVLQLPSVGQQRSCLRKEGPAFGIEMDPLLCTFEQRSPKLLLKLNDLPAER